MRNTLKEDNTGEVLDMMTTLAIEEGSLKEANRKDIDIWFAVEESADVREAVVRDAIIAMKLISWIMLLFLVMEMIRKTSTILQMYMNYLNCVLHPNGQQCKNGSIQTFLKFIMVF